MNSFSFRGWHSGRNRNGSQFSLPLSNRSFRRKVEGSPHRPRDPLLCLALSAPSFLECTIIDVAAAYPLYRIKTSSTTTTVTRRESLSSSIVASSIKWPKIIPMMRTKARIELVLVNMRDGPWRGGNSLLKPGSRNNSRKFRLPGHESSMKWKLHGDLYWCTTSSITGAIATLDPRTGNTPPQLTVYEALYDEFQPRQPVYGGVPILLLDYLVVTALLLVTDLQEWSLLPRSLSDQAGPLSAASSPLSREASYHMASRRLGAKSSSSMPSTRTGYSSRNPPTAQSGPSHVHNHQKPRASVHTDSDPEFEYVSEWRRSVSPVSEEEPRLPPEPTHGSQYPRHPSLRESVIPNDVDRNVFPSMRQTAHPFGRMHLEREQNQYNHNTPQISRANSVRNPRPLPLPPVAHISPTESSHDGASLRSQNRSARILPLIPNTSRASSDLHPTSLDEPPSQNPQATCPTDDLYGHEPIAKASRITRWLNSLTGNSPTAQNALELLLRAPIFDSPPPPYEFSLEQQQRRRQTVSSSSNPPGGTRPLDCQR